MSGVEKRGIGVEVVNDTVIIMKGELLRTSMHPSTSPEETITTHTTTTKPTATGWRLGCRERQSHNFAA